MQELKQTESGNTQFALIWKFYYQNSILNIEQGMIKPSNSLELSLPADFSFIVSTVCKVCLNIDSLWEREFSEWGLRSPDPGHSVTPLKTKLQLALLIILGLWIHQTGFYLEAAEHKCVI